MSGVGIEIYENSNKSLHLRCLGSSHSFCLKHSKSQCLSDLSLETSSSTYNSVSITLCLGIACREVVIIYFNHAFTIFAVTDCLYYPSSQLRTLSCLLIHFVFGTLIKSFEGDVLSLGLYLLSIRGRSQNFDAKCICKY